MKFVMLRAPTKQTKIKYRDQIAVNDDYYEDVSTSSDYWTVWANELLTRGWYDEVEIWYQEDKEHKAGVFKHSTGLKEVFWLDRFGFVNDSMSPDILFVRGDMPDYAFVLQALDCFKVYYPSGPYYCPNPKYDWGLCFVEDLRHIEKVRERIGAPVELFKKSCVGKYFRHRSKKKYDICFVCCAPIAERKRLMFFHHIIDTLKIKGHDVSALVIGLRDPDLIESHFRGLDVRFTGWIPRTKIGKIMAQCKIGLVLSDMERDGCPRVIQEFLAVGLPVVVSDKTCCSSIYINRKTGAVAKDADMVEAVLDMLAVSPLMDVNEFYRTSLSMSASVRHFAENVREHGGPIRQWKKT